MALIDVDAYRYPISTTSVMCRCLQATSKEFKFKLVATSIHELGKDLPVSFAFSSFSIVYFRLHRALPICCKQIVSPWHFCPRSFWFGRRQMVWSGLRVPSQWQRPLMHGIRLAHTSRLLQVSSPSRPEITYIISTPVYVCYIYACVRVYMRSLLSKSICIEAVHLTSFGRQTNHQYVTIVNIHHIAFTRAPAVLTANFYCYHKHYHVSAREGWTRAKK